MLEPMNLPWKVAMRRPVSANVKVQMSGLTNRLQTVVLKFQQTDCLKVDSLDSSWAPDLAK
jgi:hypothetical protein